MGLFQSRVKILRHWFFIAILFLATVAGGVFLLVIWQPVSLPFVSGYLRSILAERHHAYDVEFGGTLIQWRPFEDVLTIDLDSVRAIDFDGEEIASIPQLQVGVAASSLHSTEFDLRYLDVIGPRLTIVRTTGGSIKFDVGYTENGASGKILQNLLIDLVSRHGAPDDHAHFPDINIVEGSLLISDETTGAQLRFPKVNLNLRADGLGVSSTVEVDLAATNEVFPLKMEFLYRNSDRDFDFDLLFDRFRPAILADLLPGFEYLTPLEFPVSGKVSGKMSKHFKILNASFEVEGGDGSLELSEIVGHNPRLRHMSMHGTYDAKLNTITLDNSHLELDGGKVELTGLFVWMSDKLRISVQSVVSEGSIISLVPRWRAFLPAEILAMFDRDSPERFQTIVTAEGTYDPAAMIYSGRGTIARKPSAGVALEEVMSGVKIQYQLVDSVAGSPNFVTIGP